MNTLLLLALLSSLEVQPQLHPTAGGEIVIIPLRIGTTKGANGSVWSVEGAIHNAGTYPARLTIGTCLVGATTSKCMIELPPGKTMPFPEPINEPVPYNAIAIYDAGDDHQAGSSPRDVWFQLRVRDLTRQAESAGTEIPVVRTSRLLDRAANLLDVPIDPRFRTTFRLYLHPFGGGDGKFAVRVSRDDQLVVERRYSLSAPVLRLIYTGYIAAQLTVTDLFDDISCDGCRVRVEVVPETEGMRFWTFVSVTNNETSQITTISPQ